MRQLHNVVDLIGEIALKSPEAIAIIEGDGMTTSYARLLANADQVNACLQSTGIVAEEPVGILMSKSAMMIGVLLGILRSGAAYVSINVDDPPERQRRYLVQAGIKLLLTDQRNHVRAGQLHNMLADRIPGFKVIEIETFESKKWLSSGTQEIKTSGLAYISFTSGSTGEPKGVEVEHRNMLAVLRSTVDLLNITSEDCFLAASSMSFDLSVADIFLPLICGGRLVLRDNTCWTDPVQLTSDIRRYGITVVATPPSLWSLVLGPDSAFPHVRIAITCGEAAQVPLAKRLVGVCDEAWNFYGPTECTVWCTAYHITNEGLNQDKHTEASISIGHKLPGAEVRVANALGQELPFGQRGELWVTGEGLSRGYRNDRSLTEAKFVYPEGETTRYYRTGDLVAQDADGNIRYYGRIDDQMQIHGRRIEPGDIEAAIRIHEGVQDVAVTWYQNQVGSKSVVAAIVRHDRTIIAYDMHKWLSERLPKGMLPSHYAFLESIPLLPSGKVDRQSIRNTVVQGIHTPQTQLRKLTTTEAFIIEAWENVLKMECISPTDHFFAIGGDSLSAVILMTRIEAAMHVVLPDEFVYQNYTPEKMAMKLDHMRVYHEQVLLQKKRRSVIEKAMGRVQRFIRRSFIKKVKRKTRTLEEILRLQRLYMSVWQGHKASPESLLVSLNMDAKGRPLFWCMQAYWELAEIANAMPDHPIHGMRSGPGVVHMHNEQELSALASQYVKEIQSIQPDGPLILGGNCFGARIMHYVAEQMLRLGREVEMLILLELRVTRPYPGRMHLIYGQDSSSNPYRRAGTETERLYTRLFPAGYTVDIVPGSYAELFRPENIRGVVNVLHDILEPKNAVVSQRI